MAKSTKKTGRGAVYVVWGDGQEAYLERARRSLAVVHPELPSEVIRLPKDSTLLDKAAMFELSPFEETVFLDTDTVVLDRLDYGFEKARKHGLACCICECPWASRYGGLSGDMIEYNTGVLFFTPKAQAVFQRWKALSQEVDSSIRFYAGDQLCLMPLNDQAGFAQAVEEWEGAPAILPMNWNFRPKWHHSFFGPIKIWHDYDPVPETLLQWNTNQTQPDAIIQFTTLAQG